MSGDLMITTENHNTEDSSVEIDPGMINQFVTPSTARKESEVQASRVICH